MSRVDVEGKLARWILDLEIAIRNMNDDSLLELRDILKVLEADPSASADALFGLTRGRGRPQISVASKRLWRIALSWMAAMREHDSSCSLADLADMLGALRVFQDFNKSPKVVEARWAIFQGDGGGSGFELSGGLQGEEESLVAALQKIDPQFSLWEKYRGVGVGGDAVFQWSIDEPLNSQWFKTLSPSF